MSDWDNPKDDLEEKPAVEGDLEAVAEDLPEIPDEDEAM
jgi:hypothetical protein